MIGVVYVLQLPVVGLLDHTKISLDYIQYLRKSRSLKLIKHLNKLLKNVFVKNA